MRVYRVLDFQYRSTNYDTRSLDMARLNLSSRISCARSLPHSFDRKAWSAARRAWRNNVRTFAERVPGLVLAAAVPSGERITVVGERGAHLALTPPGDRGSVCVFVKPAPR